MTTEQTTKTAADWAEMTNKEREEYASARAFVGGDTLDTFAQRVAYGAYRATSDLSSALRRYREATEKARRDAEYVLKVMDENPESTYSPTHAKLNEAYAEVEKAGDALRGAWMLLAAFEKEYGGQ